jgi:hypothetical protein
MQMSISHCTGQNMKMTFSLPSGAYVVARSPFLTLAVMTGAIKSICFHTDKQEHLHDLIANCSGVRESDAARQFFILLRAGDRENCVKNDLDFACHSVISLFAMY